MILSYPLGNMANPDTLVAGTNVAQVGEASEGYFYTWTAPADGVLTLTFSNTVGWFYTINNMTTGVYGDNQYSDSNPVANPATVEVKAGHIYQIIVNTYNPANPYNPPAGTVNVNMTFVKEGEHVHDWIPATCTAPKTCSTCGATEGVAKDHVEETIPGKAATCTEEGLTEGKKCSVCGTVTKVQETIAKTAHTEETIPGKAATCTEEGLTEGKKCSVCGTVTKTQETIPATGVHTYVDGKCACGAEEPNKKPEVDYVIPEDNVTIPENDCFEDGTKVTVEVITNGDLFNKVADVMEEVAEKYVAFEFTATKDNAAVQPNGKLKVTFNLPAGYSANVAVYYMAENGKLEKLNATVDATSRTVAVELEHFSTYIVADEDTKPAPAVLMGDVNGDGEINTRDAKLIMQYELGLIDASKLNLAAADVNGDGEINTRDAKLIMQKELGIISEFPAAKKN